MNRQFTAARRTLHTWKAAQEHSEQENAKFNLHRDAIFNGHSGRGPEVCTRRELEGCGQAHSFLQAAVGVWIL